MLLLPLFVASCVPDLRSRPTPPLSTLDTGAPSSTSGPDDPPPGFEVIPHLSVTLPTTPPVTGRTEPDLPDADGDGTPDASDCAPEDPQVHPRAQELCGPRDENCDRVGWAACTPWVADTRVLSDAPIYDRIAPLGDLDADGVPDLLLTADPTTVVPGDPIARVLIGGHLVQGDVRIDEDDPAVTAPTAEVTLAPAGDLDGDGRPEILFVGTRTSGDEAIGLLTAGEMEWSVTGLDRASTWRSDVTVASTVRDSLRRAGDVDGDGVEDVGWTVVNGPGSTTTRVMSGAALLAEGPEVVAIRSEGGVAQQGWGDVDGDGLADLVIAGGADCGVTSAGCVRLYRGDQLSRWGVLDQVDRSWVPHAEGSGRAWIAGDADGDGLVDVAAIHTVGTTDDGVWSVRILTDAVTDGAGGYADAALSFEGPAGDETGGVSWSSDFDADGRADLAMSMAAPGADTVYIYLGSSLPASGRYDPHEADAEVQMARAMLPVDPVDLNGDGRDDLVAPQSAWEPAVIYAWLFTPPE